MHVFIPAAYFSKQNISNSQKIKSTKKLLHFELSFILIWNRRHQDISCDCYKEINSNLVNIRMVWSEEFPKTQKELNLQFMAQSMTITY